MTTTAARTFTFEAPLPPACLHPNSRPNRWAKAKAAREYRREVGFCILATFQSQPRAVCVVHHSTACGCQGARHRFARAVLDLEYVFATKRRRDQDGLWAWFKHGQDSIVDVGLLADDDSEHLQLGAVTMRTAAAGERPGIVATLREAP